MLARVHKGIEDMGRQRDELVAEGAGLLALFEEAMSIVHGRETDVSAIRERLTLAVNSCNKVTATTKAIRQIEISGVEKLQEELKKAIDDGVSKEYQPGVNLCLGMIESIARKGKMTL